VCAPIAARNAAASAAHMARRSAWLQQQRAQNAAAAAVAEAAADAVALTMRHAARTQHRTAASLSMQGDSATQLQAARSILRQSSIGAEGDAAGAVPFTGTKLQQQRSQKERVATGDVVADSAHVSRGASASGSDVDGVPNPVADDGGISDTESWAAESEGHDGSLMTQTRVSVAVGGTRSSLKAQTSSSRKSLRSAQRWPPPPPVVSLAHAAELVAAWEAAQAALPPPRAAVMLAEYEALLAPVLEHNRRCALQIPAVASDFTQLIVLWRKHRTAAECGIAMLIL
jgi:hypothetical protein